jgi:hypothetical protein
MSNTMECLLYDVLVGVLSRPISFKNSDTYRKALLEMKSMYAQHNVHHWWLVS